MTNLFWSFCRSVVLGLTSITGLRGRCKSPKHPSRSVLCCDRLQIREQLKEAKLHTDNLKLKLSVIAGLVQLLVWCFSHQLKIQWSQLKSINVYSLRLMLKHEFCTFSTWQHGALNSKQLRPTAAAVWPPRGEFHYSYQHWMEHWPRLLS